jgi:hypothetical protein
MNTLNLQRNPVSFYPLIRLRFCSMAVDPSLTSWSDYWESTLHCFSVILDLTVRVLYCYFLSLVKGSILSLNSTAQSGRSQWPRGLKAWVLAAWILRSWVRMPLKAWVFVFVLCCVVLLVHVEGEECMYVSVLPRLHTTEKESKTEK